MSYTNKMHPPSLSWKTWSVVFLKIFGTFRRRPDETPAPSDRDQVHAQVREESAQQRQDPPAVQAGGETGGVLLPLQSQIQEQEDLLRGKRLTGPSWA